MKFQNDICKIKNETSTKNMGPTAQILTKYSALSLSHALESILSTRLPDETFRGAIDYIKATTPAATMEEIQKAIVSLKHIINECMIQKLIISF